MQRDLLLHNALESNRVYAAKLAATIEYFLGDLRRHLAYSADVLADMETQPGLMRSRHAARRNRLGHLNSSFVVSPQGKSAGGIDLVSAPLASR